MFDELDLEEFTVRLWAGDREALTVAYREIKKCLIPYLRRKGFNSWDAEDLFHSCFFKLLKKGFPTFEPAKKSLEGWIYTIAWRVACDHMRGTKRRREVPLNACEQVTTDETINEGTNLSPHLLAAVGSAKASLSEADRSIISLAIEEDLPFYVIANTLGISENAARVRAHRALQRLWTALERSGVELPKRKKQSIRRGGRRRCREGDSSQSKGAEDPHPTPLSACPQDGGSPKSH